MNAFILRNGDWTAITPDSAGWDFVSFEVRHLEEGDSLAMTNDGMERALVPLGGDIVVDDGENRWELGGRRSVFDGRGSCIYLPTGSSFEAKPLNGHAEIAICASQSDTEFDPRLVTPADRTIELRGAGNASRQINTMLGPEFPAERLLVVEVWTPGGNWSSYPPHKHEAVAEDESVLEETYYYRTRDPWGFAYQRLYSPERSLDLNAVVHDGDLLQIPFGYHTTAAAHGCDLYYLNVLAGPNDERTLQAAYDPSLSRLADDWQNMDLDPRVPLVQ